MPRSIFGNNSQTSNPTPGMAGGTFGGRKIATGGPPGMRLAIGDEGYLWLLVIVEAFTLGMLRKKFKRYHGG